MSCPTHRALAAATLKILRSLARILLRFGVAYGDFSEWAKQAFVEVADSEFGLPGRSQTTSRVAVLTGLSRKEVAHIRHSAAPHDPDATLAYNRASRVVSAWVREPGFQDAAGRPAALPLEGTGATFTDLVRHYSGDVPPRAILDELCRVGMARLDDAGTVHLLERSYVPRSGEPEKVEILGTDAADLIATIGHNISAAEGETLFQRKVAYDNLPAKAAAPLRAEAGLRGQALIEELDRLFSRHDRDVNPSQTGDGRKRLVTGIYVYEEDWEQPAEVGRKGGEMTHADHRNPTRPKRNPSQEGEENP